MKRLRPLRIVKDNEKPKRTEGLGACKYCVHAEKLRSGRIGDTVCTVFYRRYVEDVRKRKFDALGRSYLPDCREFMEKPFSRPRRGIIGNIKLFIGKILYPFVMWLKK